MKPRPRTHAPAVRRSYDLESEVKRVQEIAGALADPRAAGQLTDGRRIAQRQVKLTTADGTASAEEITTRTAFWSEAERSVLEATRRARPALVQVLAERKHALAHVLEQARAREERRAPKAQI